MDKTPSQITTMLMRSWEIEGILKANEDTLNTHYHRIWCLSFRFKDDVAYLVDRFNQVLRPIRNINEDELKTNCVLIEDLRQELQVRFKRFIAKVGVETHRVTTVDNIVLLVKTVQDDHIIFTNGLTLKYDSLGKASLNGIFLPLYNLQLEE